MKLTAHIVDLLIHIQHVGFEVQVVPLQCHEFTTAQTSCQVQKEHFVVALELRLNEKPLQLLPRQHLHLPHLLGRQLAALGGIGADESILYSPLERRAAGRVTHPHHTVR